ncbi:MAG: putative porin [Bacteroidia bacterium]|nr:putative porin [Bacteroidia bacterium]NND09740.1 putative porin [Flavobacteriaceae bacterium]NNK27127.1 putative porin [Flavobacteriaceae bacterium]
MRVGIILFFLLFLSVSSAWSQEPKLLKIDKEKAFSRNNQDTLSRSIRESRSRAKKNLEAKIADYKIISITNDTTFVDTTLTIYKDYKYNYLRKDDFGLMPFANLGQTYNQLMYDFHSIDILPSLGAKARHFNYMKIEDIDYYYVPTPLTELMFKTAFEQGQLIDAFFTVNTSEQFNFSIAYKALRSLGKYQHALTSTGNLRFTTNYKTKNDKYNIRAHVVMQDLLNEENGGIIDDEISRFESGEEEFKDRSIFQVNFEDAQNLLDGKRYYLDHNFKIISKKDSIQDVTLKLGNELYYEDKFYRFEQDRQNDFFGEAFQSANIRDNVKLEHFHANAYVNYRDRSLGDFRFKLGHTSLNYGYDKVIVLDSQTIPNRIKGNAISVKGQYQNKIGKLELNGMVSANVSGDFDGNSFFANVAYPINDNNKVSFGIASNSRRPDFNFLLYQSAYENYNWFNEFENIKTRTFSSKLEMKKIANIDLSYNNIDNYTYFQQSIEKATRPLQASQAINYLNVRLSRELRYGNFALDNTIAYQNVIDGEGILNVPQLTTRNTLYYANHFFKKALFLQTGITFKYFTKYNMNAYDPLLAEFYVQNDQEFGGFPMLDFFINAKIRQTRIFLMAEHFNSSFTGYDYYSAPNNPYRDFTVRFGLVWNFFL